MEFKNKTALITGAAVGIGRACALLFAEMGATLILLDTNINGLISVREELSQISGREHLIYECDISDKERVFSIVEDAAKKTGGIDILVNNAALWRHRCAFAELDLDVWEKYFSVNVHGTAYVTRAALPYMIDKKYGRIINVASVAGMYGNGMMATYSATKGAVISFTKALAKEVAGYGITVNSVSPGSVSPSADSNIDAHIPSDLSYLGRTGTDRENADLICFLASKKSSYITGENIAIDGGRRKL